MPRLAYEDADAAIRFLTEAYGFSETARFAPGGQVVHAEIALHDETLFAVGTASSAVASPRKSGSNTVQLFCYVDDVDAHFERAKTHGAEILSAPQDQPWGDRSYDTLDIEGHRWTFRKHVQDVPLDELLAKLGNNLR